jgi:hypothetical protein
MIAKILPEIYDISGKKVTKPTTKKHKWLFPSTYPMGRYLSQPLRFKCHDINDLRAFLQKCSYVSDQEQFNKEDHWMPPEEFEKKQQGDCDDYSLWVWRQLIEMGYTTRFVVGLSGKYEEGHAWVTYIDRNIHYLLEPLLNFTHKMPQLSIVRYRPKFSCEWDGEKLSYFIHEDRPFNINVFKLTKIAIEWLLFWCSFWLSRVFLLVIKLPLLLGIKYLEPFSNDEPKIKLGWLSRIHHYASAITFLIISLITASLISNKISSIGYVRTLIFFSFVFCISLFIDFVFVRLKNRFKYICIILTLAVFYFSAR